MQATLHTSLGPVRVVLDPVRAPRTVASFVAHARAGFYDGTLFHRVVPGFVIQGGGYGPGLAPRRVPERPLPNEADNGLSNRRGTLAMARTGEPHSATTQFFVNLADNTFLDHREPTPEGWGYCVFGQVVEGMEVVDRIGAVPTGLRGGHRDVPLEDVLLERVELHDRAPA